MRKGLAPGKLAGKARATNLELSPAPAGSDFLIGAQGRTSDSYNMAFYLDRYFALYYNRLRMAPNGMMVTNIVVNPSAI